MGSDPILVVGGGAAGLMAAHHGGARGRGAGSSSSMGRGGSAPRSSSAAAGDATSRTARSRRADFNGGSSRVIARVLRALPVEPTVRFFEELGVPLHEEAHGKLFPDSNRAATVLDALLGEAARARRRRCGIPSASTRIAQDDGGFAVTTDAGVLRARARGAGQRRNVGAEDRQRRRGVRLRPRAGTHHRADDARAGAAPARRQLPPRRCPGVSHPVEMTVRSPGVTPRRISGDLLWTHFGASGPAALDVSRHWHRAAIEGREVRVDLSFRPGEADSRRWTRSSLAQPPRGHAPRWLQCSRRGCRHPSPRRSLRRSRWTRRARWRTCPARTDAASRTR